MLSNEIQQNKELIEKAAEELAWIFVALAEQKITRKKNKEKNKNENRSNIQTV